MEGLTRKFGQSADTGQACRDLLRDIPRLQFVGEATNELPVLLRRHSIPSPGDPAFRSS